MSDINFSLVDLKAVEKPALKLIESVRSAVGVLYEPTQIRRRAAAEADAAIIFARNQCEVRDIEIRASERFRETELRRQRNIEDVTRAALKALPDKVSSDPVDEDWVYQFYEHCQDIRNDQMQHLWGKILAGEVAKPGTYSLRSLRLIKDIQQKDADVFTRFCTFLWMLPGKGQEPIIPDKGDPHISACGIHFSDLLHLEDLGLIQFGQVTGFGLRGLKDAIFPIFYYGKHHIIRMPANEDKFEFGCALLTSIGKELTPIAGSEPNEEYRKWIVENLKSKQYVVEEL